MAQSLPAGVERSPGKIETRRSTCLAKPSISYSESSKLFPWLRGKLFAPRITKRRRSWAKATSRMCLVLLGRQGCGSRGREDFFVQKWSRSFGKTADRRSVNTSGQWRAGRSGHLRNRGLGIAVQAQAEAEETSRKNCAILVKETKCPLRPIMFASCKRGSLTSTTDQTQACAGGVTAAKFFCISDCARASTLDGELSRPKMPKRF